MRHSYTTLLRQNENDPKWLQGLLRWASLKMMNVYDEVVAPRSEQHTKEPLQNLSRRTSPFGVEALLAQPGIPPHIGAVSSLEVAVAVGTVLREASRKTSHQGICNNVTPSEEC